MTKTLLALAAGLLLAGRCLAADPGWPEYGGDAGGQRFSAAHQITPANVASLAVAWTFSTGDMTTHGNVMKRASFENTPTTRRIAGCASVAAAQSAARTA